MSNLGIFGNIGYKFNKIQFYQFMEDLMIIIQQEVIKLIN